MKRKYSPEQKAYLKACEALEMLQNKEAFAERKYLSERNILNSENAPAEKIYELDGDLFDKCNEEFGAWEEQTGLWGKICKARDAKTEAEKALVKYALDIIPASMAHVREVLEKAATENYTERQKIIELVMTLDASTVTKKI